MYFWPHLPMFWTQSHPPRKIIKHLLIKLISAQPKLLEGDVISLPQLRH